VAHHLRRLQRVCDAQELQKYEFAHVGKRCRCRISVTLAAPASAQNLLESFFGSLSRTLNAPMRQSAPIHAFAEPSVRFESLIKS
jgi:hypothetical protein